MTPLEFLTSVWPAEGYYCLAFPGGDGKFAHAVFDTIEAATVRAEKDRQHKNIYFATHSLIEERIWNEKHHKGADGEWVASWSVRLQRNMRSSRIVFFDIDVGAAKEKYHDQIQAVVALREFVETCSLPRPLIVSSGNGLHVYWVMNEDLASHVEWLTLASRFRQLALHHKLKIDMHRTVDMSSVLRVPGTFNFKKDSKLAVEALTKPEIVSAKTLMHRVCNALEIADVEPAERIIADDDLLGSNIEPHRGNLTPPDVETVFQICPQLARIRAANGDLREPEWYAALGALQFAEGGREACHAISKGHATYQHAYVEGKIDQWKFGPTSCQKLALNCGGEHDAICRACPHVVKHSGPISIARLLEKAPAPTVEETIDGETFTRTIPDPPKPYKRSKKGAIEIIVEGKNGQEFSDEVHPYDIYPIDRVVNDDAETETQLWRVHLPHGRIKDFAITASTFVDMKALRARLANNGIYSSQFEKLAAYMSAYIQELQRRNATNIQYNNLGWARDHTEFVLPYGVIRSDGDIYPVSLGNIAETAKEFVTRKGTLEAQVELMKFFKDERYIANQFFISCALGSPLYPFTGHYGVIVNATGEPGASKSTALFTAASIWGRPRDYVVNGTQDGATTHSRATRMHLLSNLPFCLDEITHIAHDVAKNMAMNATQPGVRGRLNSDGSPKKSFFSEKSSITMTTANISLHSLLAQQNAAGSAAAVRVFELTFHKLGVHLPYEISRYMRELSMNYGHVGEVYAKFITRHQEKAAARTIIVQEELERQGNMQPDERFWFAVSASALVGAEIANRLNLIKYDTSIMKSWLLDVQLPDLRRIVRAEAEAAEPLTLLTDYIATIHGDICKVGSDTGNIYYLPNVRLLGHYDVDKQQLDLLKDGFRRFCTGKNQYYQMVIKMLLANNIVGSNDMKRTLGRGTILAKGRSNCFTVNMQHPSIAANEVIEQLTTSNIVPIKGPRKS